MVERGLKQRVQALNLFIGDIYNERHILHDGIIPTELIETSKTIRTQMTGFRPPQGAWCHISAVSIWFATAIEDPVCLEDKPRCPSGVSYVLENRELMKHTFPQVFDGMAVRPVEDYPERLLETLLSCAPASAAHNPRAVLLTPRTTRPTLSTPTWLNRWEWSWFKAPIWLYTTAMSTCEPLKGCSEWM